MRRLIVPLVLALAACDQQQPSPSNELPTTTTTTTTAGKPGAVQIPNVNGSGLPMFLSGGLQLGADTQPGSATITQAPRWLESEESPSSFGTGSVSVTVAGTSYQISPAQSFYAIDDGGGAGAYFIAGAVQIDEAARTARVLYVISKEADVVAGANVALDGTDRLALFASGSLDAEAPDVVAVATTGTIHFLTGAPGASAPIDLTLDAAFAQAELEDLGEPREPEPPAAPLPAGSYTLQLDATEPVVDCDDAISSVAFVGLAPSVSGFANTAVEISAGAQVELRGAGLVGGFGADTIALSYQASPYEPWVGVGQISGGNWGPDLTIREAAAITLNANPGGSAPITGHVTAVYASSNRSLSAYCQISYPISLH